MRFQVKVERLCATNFRNLAELDFSPGSGANIIFGDNAQGKTNLIEAIWLFSGAKSFRGAKDGEFTSFGAEVARLALDFEADGRAQTASIAFSGEKKTAALNEIKQDSVNKLAGIFCAVVFSPDHLALVKQGPDKRRRLIDVSLCQAYPKYMRLLDGYNRVLKQRNTLLKDMQAHPSLAGTLEIWDETLLDYGAYITSMRARYVKKLSALAKEAYEGISSHRESFSAEYVTGFDCVCDKTDREAVRAQFRNAVEQSRGDDIRQGITTVGPHRDDVEIVVGGVSARSFGSQGQQRSCILALKLAECMILEERNHEPPVILLDDVMSELDHHRRDYLLNQLDGKQVFITCCDAEAFSGLSGGRVFEIKAGSLLFS